ncbi:MAG: hypothetical protein AB7F96_18755 [Beijerinckiaceae bacterium]
MAKTILAMTTTHGPQLHTTAEQWALRLPADRTNKHPYRDGVYTFDELVELRKGENLAERSTMAAMEQAHARCEEAMTKMAGKWDAAGADVAIIFGNDQREIYGDELSPPFMVYCGGKIPHYPATEEAKKKMPPGIAEADSGHSAPEYREYDGIPDLGEHIVRTLTEADFDITISRQWPSGSKNGASHAFGHIYRQVMRDNVVPNVPVYQNTFFPPNQPSARRAYEFGKVVKQAVDSWQSDKKVAAFGSGGMTHFTIDEDFDRAFLDALKNRDKDWLTSIPLKTLQSGTSELKSWISLMGYLENEDVAFTEVDYVPCYRSPAGTGTAQGFCWWDVG